MIVRESRRERFTVVSNDAIEDHRLSFQAKGLLLYLLSKPDGWSVSRDQLATVGPNRVDSVRAMLTELEKCGYLTRIRKADGKGRFTWESIIHETPRPLVEKPPMVQPPMVKPPVENPTLVNTDVVKTEVVNTDRDIHPLTPKGDACEADEEPVDAFTPEELTVPPMPRRQSRRVREKASEEMKQKRLAIMCAFRAARFGRPATDPVPPAEFDRMRAAADDLITVGATTEQVQAATERALLEWPQDSMVTLRAIAGNWTALTSATKTQSKPSAQKLTQREQAALIDQKYAQRWKEDCPDFFAQLGIN